MGGGGNEIYSFWPLSKTDAMKFGKDFWKMLFKDACLNI